MFQIEKCFIIRGIKSCLEKELQSCFLTADVAHSVNRRRSLSMRKWCTASGVPEQRHWGVLMMFPQTQGRWSPLQTQSPVASNLSWRTWNTEVTETRFRVKTKSNDLIHIMCKNMYFHLVFTCKHQHCISLGVGCVSTKNTERCVACKQANLTYYHQKQSLQNEKQLISL